MANLFTSQKNTATTPREALEAKYNNSIVNLLLVVAFSAINVVLLVVKSNTYFLFSAFIPYFIADLGMYYTGSYPEDYYYDVGDMEFADKSFLIICVAVAVAVILLYLLSWFFARKKKVGWLIFASVLFCIDTVVMFLLTGINADMIMDIVFHAWVIFSLINGVVTYFKLKKLPVEEVVYEAEENTAQANEFTEDNSRVLRMADTDVKARILLEAETAGYRIVYRRVKKTNELVVNGRVYDEYEALVEFPHILTATPDGHKIEVHYETSGVIRIYFDGKEIAKKLRII